jgi:hypothetical protein
MRGAVRTALVCLALLCGAQAQPRGSTIVGKPGVAAAGALSLSRAARRARLAPGALHSRAAPVPALTRPARTRARAVPARAAPPVLSSLSPAVGVREGGVTVTLVGAGFQRTRGLSVRFSTAAGSTVVPAQFVDASTIGARPRLAPKPRRTRMCCAPAPPARAAPPPGARVRGDRTARRSRAGPGRRAAARSGAEPR